MTRPGGTGGVFRSRRVGIAAAVVVALLVVGGMALAADPTPDDASGVAFIEAGSDRVTVATGIDVKGSTKATASLNNKPAGARGPAPTILVVSKRPASDELVILLTGVTTRRVGVSWMAWNGDLPQGPEGPQGQPGGPGISGYEIITEIVTLGADGSSADLRPDCPAGKKVLGGGQWSGDGIKRLDVWRNGPNGDSSWLFSWTVQPGGAGRTVAFSLICAAVTP